MNKVTVTYDLEIPDRYELAEPKPRFPKKGENYLLLSGAVQEAKFDFTHGKHFILRPVWKWPEWIKAEWLFQTRSGCWYVKTGSEPSLTSDGNLWMLSNSYVVSEDMFDFTPPPCNNWRESLRRNPKFGS